MVFFKLNIVSDMTVMQTFYLTFIRVQNFSKFEIVRNVAQNLEKPKHEKPYCIPKKFYKTGLCFFSFSLSVLNVTNRKIIFVTKK